MWMKYYKKIVWFAAFCLLSLLAFVAVKFKVDDMTLSKGSIYEFNEGWTLAWPDGTVYEIEELPYLGKSEPGEVIFFENTIPKEYFGKTMSFLSADKTLRIWMDEELVYEFGIGDERSFGHTPGSVVNFVDIPQELTEGKVRMEMVSPYPDYGARVTAIDVGDRDVLILNLLMENLFSIACNLLIVVCGIMFLMLSLILKISKQDTGGVQYLCGYCIVVALYYCIETKILHIFYGNQTFYSVMVFVCIMMIPFFIALYYANGILSKYKHRWQVLLLLICINIAAQLVLQLTDLVDFMNMSYFSHALIMLTIAVVAKSYYDLKKESRNRSVNLGMLALMFMAAGGVIDIVRMYVVAVGDMGKFSRVGSAFFAAIMLYQHFAQMVKGYSHNINENARLLKNEIELIEKQNNELKKAKELAEEARQEAMTANASKDRFLAHMSHEIRTPINAVLGMDTMILRESKEMQIKEYALDIQNAGQNLLSLINDILDFSKIESGKLEIINVEYDLSSLIHDISNMIKSKAESKHLKLDICVDESLPSKLLGDDVRIRQVLVNLLNNAVKYTQEGTVTLKVDGTVEGGKAVFNFTVQDTGIGIKEEDISRLFKEFERIEEKRNRSIEGTGLGLSITKQLLQLMDSKLMVESEYGKGSRFSFRLEQTIVDAAPIGNLAERIKEQATRYSYTAAFTAPEAEILVVDDNLTNHKVFVNLLKGTKMNIDVTDCGTSCLELVAEKHYDLIFLDHMMPGMDGIETLHHMQQMPDNPCKNTPVVALTANAITGAKEMYLREGFHEFLSKPINPDRLEQMILKLLPERLLKFGVDEAENAVDEAAAAEAEEEDLPILDGIDWDYALMHLPDRKLLFDTISDFYKAVMVEADALDAFYKEIKSDAEALTRYRIKVHTMKSSANLIGAVALGGMAKVLEDAARDGDFRTIDALHGIFTAQWRGCREKLKECAAVEAAEEKEEADASVILAYLELLREAMEELDIDAMDDAMAKLEEIRYTEEMQADMEKLAVFVINMDSGQALELIEKLKHKLQERMEGVRI